VHDVLGGMLTSIRMDAARILRRADTAELPQLTRGLIALTQEAIETVKGISEALRPSQLEHLELSEVVAAELNEFTRRFVEHDRACARARRRARHLLGAGAGHAARVVRPLAAGATVIDVLVVDDHTIFRSGIRRLLLDEPDMRVVGEARNGSEALELIRAQRFSLALLDIDMDGRSGLELLCSIRNLHNGLPVLMLSMYPEEQYALVVIRRVAAAPAPVGSPAPGDAAAERGFAHRDRRRNDDQREDGQHSPRPHP